MERMLARAKLRVRAAGIRAAASNAATTKHILIGDGTFAVRSHHLGGAMAEASRTDAAAMNTRKLPGTETYSGEAKAPPSRPELPQTASPANNPALNRSAEALGRGMGVAVA